MGFSRHLGPSGKFGKTALLTGVPFGAFMGLFWIFWFSLLPAWLVGFSLMPPLFGAALGLASGVLFGALMAAFVGRQERSFALQDPRAPGEKLVKQGGANHFRRGEAVGGYLWLTDRRLLFRSHRHNLQNHELSIPLRDVEGARPYLVAGVVPTGLRVYASGRREHFVVGDRRAWAAGIGAAADRLRLPPDR